MLGDVESSLGDAASSLGDAESSLGDAESSLSDAESSLGDAESSLGDAMTTRCRMQLRTLVRRLRAFALHWLDCCSRAKPARKLVYGQVSQEVDRVGSHGRWEGPGLQTNPECDPQLVP